jgi:hypothetical protein
MIYRVIRPIVSSHRTPAGSTTIVHIPIGGIVELREEPHRVGLVEVVWDGKRFSIFAMDLLDCAERVAATM